MHTLGKCEVLVNAYRSDIKDHESRWEQGEIISIVASLPDENITYRIDVKPINKDRFYRACHPDCVRNI